MFIISISYCVLETHSNIQMSSLLHFYRARSATALNQLKPLQHVRSRSPDDVLQRQKVITYLQKKNPSNEQFDRRNKNKVSHLKKSMFSS
jgi:hypothetical protein